MSAGERPGPSKGGGPRGGGRSAGWIDDVPRACHACLRRTALIAALAGHLDHAHARRGIYDEVFALSDEELLAALVPDEPARERLREAAGRAAEELAAAARGSTDGPAAGHASVVALCRHDPGYPDTLAQLAGPPAVLFTSSAVRLAELTASPAVAVVGARRASAYGLEVARALGRGLSAAGVVVVSGMAMGVDAMAHEGALEAGGRTTAALGSGVDVAYPATKRGLHARLVAEAAVVSELPPGFGPRRWTFPARNRIIAALAAVTVVVEAAERSGALITARVARELGRDVAAVPGRITSPLAAGPNALLRDGAHLVDGPRAVLDLLLGVGERLPAGDETARPGESSPELDAGLAAVLEAVRAGADSTAAVAERLAGRNVPAPTSPPGLMAALGELELLGLVRRGRGGTWVAVA